MKRFALAIAALLLAGAAQAQTATDAPFYSNEAGIPKPAQGMVLIGVDSGTSLPCIIGTVTTCTLPVGIPVSASTNITQFGSVNLSTGTGLGGAGIPRVTVSSDSTVGITGTLPAFAAIPAFKIDQTTPGTTNGVQINAALPAGTNVIGHVITDAGSVSSVTLQAGSAVAGKVGIDQTTPGTTNGVQVNAALPAGANVIGKAGIDQTTPGTTNAIVKTNPVVATYSATSAGLSIAATATDVFTIAGSGTKTIRLNKIRISCLATASTESYVILVKRSSADTGGTPGALNKVPNDSGEAAATATVLQYTTNPGALGTVVGNIGSIYLPFAISSAAALDVYTFTFGDSFDAPLTLRGTAEQLGVYFNATTPAGAVCNIDVEWTEQ